MISSYHEKYYSPANMLIAISGKIEEKKLLKKISDIYLPLKSQAVKDFDYFKKSQKRESSNFLNKPTEQTHLLLGFHAPKRNSASRYALSLLSTILGGNMSSRLFEQVREQRGLAYQISSSLRKFDETGALIIDAGIKNKKMLEAITIIFKELELIKKELVNSQELESAKEFICGQLLLYLDGCMNNALWLGEKILLDDKARDIKEIIKKIKAVKAQDIFKTAENVLSPAALNLAIIGPIAKNKKNILNELRNFK
jgi:predicted Zn-dependent peptidase